MSKGPQEAMGDSRKVMKRWSEVSWKEIIVMYLLSFRVLYTPRIH